MVSSQSKSNTISEPEIVTPTASESNASMTSEASSTTKGVTTIAKKVDHHDPAEAFFDREGGADIVKWFMIWLESERLEGKLHTGK